MKVLVIEPVECYLYEQCIGWRSFLRQLREKWEYHDLPHSVTMVER